MVDKTALIAAFAAQLAESLKPHGFDKFLKSQRRFAKPVNDCEVAIVLVADKKPDLVRFDTTICFRYPAVNDLLIDHFPWGTTPKNSRFDTFGIMFFNIATHLHQIEYHDTYWYIDDESQIPSAVAQMVDQYSAFGFDFLDRFSRFDSAAEHFQRHDEKIVFSMFSDKRAALAVAFALVAGRQSGLERLISAQREAAGSDGEFYGGQFEKFLRSLTERGRLPA